MLVLINTISVAIARALAGAASILLQLLRSVAQARADRARVEAVAKLTAALFEESNPVPVKYALSSMGMLSPAVRLPLVELNSDSKAEIDAVLAQVCDGYSGYLIGEDGWQEKRARIASRAQANAAFQQVPDQSGQAAWWSGQRRGARSAAVPMSTESRGTR
jgi:hypothetical protein